MATWKKILLGNGSSTAFVKGDGSYDTTVYSTTTGTVTAVNVASPLSTSGGNAPTISIAASSASTSGTMSTAQFNKLAGIADNANNYSLPVATASVLGGVKAGTNITIGADGTISAQDASVAWSELTGVPATFTPSTHTHDYLPLTGGTVSGTLTVSDLTVNGTTTTLNTEEIKLADNEIVLNSNQEAANTNLISMSGGIMVERGLDGNLTGNSAKKADAVLYFEEAATDSNAPIGRWSVGSKSYLGVYSVFPINVATSSGVAPTADSIGLGSLHINTADGSAYIRTV